MSFLRVVLFIGAIAPVLSERHVDPSASTSPNKQACLRLSSKVCHISANTTSSVNILHLQRSRSHDAATDLIINALAECLWQRNMPMLIYNQSMVTQPVNYTTFNIFVVPSREEGPQYVQAMLQHRLDNEQRSKHEHHYVFVWPAATDGQFADLFKEAWHKARVLNLLGVKASRLPSGLFEASVHTYEPFSPQGFRSVAFPTNTTSYFYDKLANMHGATLRISMFFDEIRAIPRPNVEQQGFDSVDGIVASTMVSHLNATGVYVIPRDNDNYGSCLPNGTFTGSLGDVVNRRTDVHFNMRWVFDCSRPRVEQLYPHGKRFLYLVVPSARQLPEYLIFVSSSSKVMGLFLVMLPGFLVLQHWVRRIYPAGELDSARLTWIEAAMLFLRSQWGQPVERYSRISSLRFYLITWILYCYVLTTIYFAKLESSFVHPHYESAVDSLDDLPRLNVTIYGLVNVFRILDGSLDPRKYELIMQRARVLPTTTLTLTPHYPLLIWRTDKNAAFVLRHDKAKVFVVQTRNVLQNRPNYHIVRENLRSIPYAYMVDRGSPYRYKLEEIERHLHEGGLMDYWQEKALQRSMHAQAKSGEELPAIDHEDGKGDAAAPHHTARAKKVVLTMEILQGAFYLWAGGVTAGVVAFVGELVHRRVRECRAARRVKIEVALD